MYLKTEPHNEGSKMREEIHNSAVVTGDISIPLPIMNKTMWQKINKDKKILTTLETNRI